MVEFTALTEVAGDDVSQEQIERLSRRYYWAGEYCRGRRALEVACGTAQGAGYLGSLTRFLIAGDLSLPLLNIGREHFGSRLSLIQLDCQRLPCAGDTLDAVLILEALYYIPDLDSFFAECRRVLRVGGVLLIATANADLFDFNPSPRSYRYLGVVELEQELTRHGFTPEFFGDTPLKGVSARQRFLRPIKAAASALGLIPKSMAGKRLLKRLVFGRLTPMPHEITTATAAHIPPKALPAGRPDHQHKVILCAARLNA